MHKDADCWACRRTRLHSEILYQKLASVKDGQVDESDGFEELLKRCWCWCWCLSLGDGASMQAFVCQDLPDYDVLVQ
jgi:hypothetical protein